jgi:hypothetical protein
MAMAITKYNNRPSTPKEPMSGNTRATDVFYTDSPFRPFADSIESSHRCAGLEFSAVDGDQLQGLSVLCG